MAYSSLRFDYATHKDALAKLWLENMSDGAIGSVVDQRMRWLYEQNPLGPTATWLVQHDATQEIVGCASLYPRTLWLKGDKLRAGIGMDLAISKAHRIAGPAILLQRAIQKQHRAAGFDLTYTYPNRGSVPILKRVGFEVVGEAGHWVKPVRTGYKIADYVDLKPIADVAAFVLDRALGLADRRHLGADVLARRYKGSLVDSADERFDDLFRRAKDAYPIVGEKTSAYLNWRYTTCPTAKFTYFCLTERKTSRLAGFVVYTVRGNKAFVADAFAESIDETLPHLFVRFGSAARRAKYDSIFIAYAGMSAFSKKIEELDFLKRDFARPFVSSAQQDLSPMQRAAVSNLQNWFLFDGELDL